MSTQNQPAPVPASAPIQYGTVIIKRVRVALNGNDTGAFKIQIGQFGSELHLDNADGTPNPSLLARLQGYLATGKAWTPPPKVSIAPRPQPAKASAPATSTPA